MRHNINIIFKRPARDRISIMGCIESLDAGLVAFSLGLPPPCRRVVVPPTPFRRIWSKTLKRGCSASTTTPRRSFSPVSLFLHPVQVVAFCLMDGIRSLFFSVCPCLGIKEKRYRHRIYIPDTCPPLHLPFSRLSYMYMAEGRRVFSLDATRRDCPLRFLSVSLVVSRASTVRPCRLDVV